MTGRADAGTGSIRLSGISEEKAWRRRSCGVGTCAGCDGASAVAPSAGCGSWRSRERSSPRGGWARCSAGGAFWLFGWAGGVVPSAGSAAGSSMPSVLRNRAASGPSRILARLAFAMVENLLRELPVGLGRNAVGLVLEHRHPLHRRLCKADGLADARGEHAV